MPGAVEVSIVIGSGAEAGDVLPLRSVCFAVTSHTPSLSAGRSHEVAGKTYEHDTGVAPAFEAVMVMRSPATASTGVADIVGVSSLVMLSVNELPESDDVARSTAVGAAGAVLSTSTLSAGPAGEVLPAGSVTFDVIDHVPSDIAGRSQLFTVGDAT